MIGSQGVPSLVIGIGLTSTASSADVEQLVDATLADIGRASSDVRSFATIESRRGHQALDGIETAPIVYFSARALAQVDVPYPSDRVESFVGARSVAEASALLGAGPGAELLVAKRVSERVTVAIASAATAAAPVT